MRPWTHFFPDVMPSVPAVAEPMAEHHIRRATQDFCRRTRAWSEELDAVLTLAGKWRYDLELPPMAELVRLESATFAGEPLDVGRRGDRGRFAHTSEGKTVELSFAPADGVALIIRASLAPSNEAIALEDALFDRYAEVIANGAIARLTNDETKAGQFQAQCDRIKTDLWRGMSAVSPRTVPNYF